MQMVELMKSGPALADEHLNAVERALRVTLPNDYRKLMLKSNGGILSIGDFQYKDGTGGSHISCLYHILTDDVNDILTVAKNRDGRLPVGFVAIGPDPYGNEICIDCNPGVGYGKVYFWDHEMEADASQGNTPDTAENVHLIADSFAGFLESLHDSPPANEQPTGRITFNSGRLL